ncbi:MAG: hypothetical protein LBC03_06245 [Nitrososphaerota archaeon]|jgi:hypothetical protein|nr:hypothetical protein [Nitrososphaerota archaeon]
MSVAPVKTKYKISEKEIEVANLFSKIGYLVRCHLQIYPVDLKNNASDIDVLAMKFNHRLTPETVLVEVKEGYGKVSEFFQFFGFKSYFHPDATYFVCNNILEVTRQISKKLGIHALTFKRLNEIVERDVRKAEELKLTDVPLDVKDIEKIMDNLLTIKKKHEDLYWKYHYLWLEVDPYLRLFNLQSMFFTSCELDDKFKSQEEMEALEWFQQELFCLTIIATVLIAYDCIDLEQDQIGAFIQDKFYNLGTSKEGKLKVKKGVEQLISLIDKLSPGAAKVDSIEVIPQYVDTLVDLVKFVISNSAYIQCYIIIDSNIQKLTLKGKGDNFRKLVTSKVQSEKIEKLNTQILKILYKNKPISMTFKNFV